jgi:CDP-glucose 4,6-dehydratase
VLEPLCGYLKLAEQMWQRPTLAGAYNFGPQTHEAATVRDVVQLAQSAYGTGQVAWGDGTAGPHEAGWLALEISKSRSVLGVKPRWHLAESVQRTMRWYLEQQKGADAGVLCRSDIAAYEVTSELRQSS